MSDPALHIDDVDALVAALESTSSERYLAMLQAVRFGAEDVASFAFFEKRSYTRNLIARTAAFELLALCWMPGHRTPIHDHASSGGWVLGVSGRLEEVRYAPDCVSGRTTPRVVGSERFGAGEASYIDDDIALHAIENVGDVNAISLHLYSPPIDACRYYDVEAGEFRIKRMSYHSIKGVVGAQRVQT